MFRMNTTSCNDSATTSAVCEKEDSQWRRTEEARSLDWMNKYALDRNTSIASHGTPTTAASETSEISSFASAHIHFSEIVRVCHVLNLAEYTQEEVNASFYQDHEYNSIAKSCITAVHKMEKRRKQKTRTHAKNIESRGLEGHTATGNITKMASRRLAYDTVLLEQEDQKIQGTYDDEIIAECYESVSSSCALWAREIALRDRRDAEGYLFD